MSAAFVSAVTAALATAATTVAAALPEARDVLSPLTEGGGEFATTAGALLIALPVIAVMTLVAGSTQD